MCSRSQRSNELRHVGSVDGLQQPRAAEDRRAHHPQEIVDRVCDPRLGIDNCDVDIAVHFRAGGRLRDDLERDARMFGAKISQDRNGEAIGERRRQRDFQDTLRPALFLDHLRQCLIDAIERFRHHRENVTTRLRQHELLRATLKQGNAEKVLQHDDMAAHRALCDRQTIGRRCEAEVLTRRLEGAQRVKRQPFAVHRASRLTTRKTSFLTRPMPGVSDNTILLAPSMRKGRRNLSQADPHLARKCRDGMCERTGCGDPFGA